MFNEFGYPRPTSAFNEVGHPSTSLSHWNAFHEYFPSLYFDELIERKELDLPDDILPLARGGVVASTRLLRLAGCRPGSRLAHGWMRWSNEHDFCWSWEPFRVSVVRKTDNFWLIARHKNSLDIEYLVFPFGSTLVITRDCRSAKHLARYFFENELPGKLRWVKAFPDNDKEALELLRQRQIEDAKYVALH
jgi:hypothetical protein